MSYKKILYRLYNILFLLIFSCTPTKTSTLPAPFMKAHAHNDYRHPHPLFDALAYGYVSVEADIHHVDGKLFVAHDTEDITNERTLQALYLDPLRKIVKENRGKVYEGDISFILLIDIKSNADTTYRVLREVLKKYKDMLTYYNRGECKKGAVTIIVSGNRPSELMKNEIFRLAAYDGRPEDLESQIPNRLIPLISANWTDYFKWNGEGPIPIDEKKYLNQFVNKAHQQGRQVRFWATDVASPLQQNFWKTLLENEVDFIGTDKLKILKDFLLKNK